MIYYQGTIRTACQAGLTTQQDDDASSRGIDDLPSDNFTRIIHLLYDTSVPPSRSTSHLGSSGHTAPRHIMFGPFRVTSPLSGGLLWKIPWRLSKFQKRRQRLRLRAVDTVVETLDAALSKKGMTVAAVEHWKSEMPTEAEMLPRDKYTMFDRKEKRYRKGIHSKFLPPFGTCSAHFFAFLPPLYSGRSVLYTDGVFWQNYRNGRGCPRDSIHRVIERLFWLCTT